MKQGLVRLLYNFGKRFMGWTLVVERLSTDIEWLVEIHCSSDDRSGSSAH